MDTPYTIKLSSSKPKRAVLPEWMIVEKLNGSTHINKGMQAIQPTNEPYTNISSSVKFLSTSNLQ